MADAGACRRFGHERAARRRRHHRGCRDPTVRLGNIAQISRKTARVSGTQQAVDHAGRDDELAYQEMLKGLEMKRDMETILLRTRPR
jgi:hypothetical protein